MPVEVIMPKVDMDMTSGKISLWHVAEGEAVTKGDPLFDIETDKAAMEVEAPETGRLYHLTAQGTDVAIGQPVAWLYGEGEALEDPPSAPNTSIAEPVQTEPAQTEPVQTESAQPAHQTGAHPASAPEDAVEDASDFDAAKPRATPLARRLAKEAGLGIDALPGSGPLGRVQAEDVRAALRQHSAPLSGPAGFTPETGPLSVTRAQGGTGTPVVLIHGFASDARSWGPLEAHLRHRPLIRIELPAHGASPKLRVAGFADLAKILRQTFDDLHLEQAHLIGHSLGGALALALADTRPRAVASLCLIAPAGLGPDVNGDVLSGICKATRPESLRPWLRSLVADETRITDGYVRQAMTPRLDPALRAAQAALAEVLFPDGVQAFDLRAALERITAPTQLVWGKRDAIIPWRHALCAPGRVALHLFDNLGHMPQLENTEELGKIIALRL